MAKKKKEPPKDMIGGLYGDRMFIIWSVDDVKCVRPNLTIEQCRNVLEEEYRMHDASIGVTWDTIIVHADYLFPPDEQTQEALDVWYQNEGRWGDLIGEPFEDIGGAWEEFLEEEEEREYAELADDALGELFEKIGRNHKVMLDAIGAVLRDQGIQGIDGLTDRVGDDQTPAVKAAMMEIWENVAENRYGSMMDAFGTWIRSCEAALVPGPEGDKLRHIADEVSDLQK